jgi:glucose-6-phosphate isomerase
MELDIGNALAEVASPGVSEETLDRLDDRVATAHERIAAGKAEGELGYESLNLPSSTDATAIQEAVSGFDDPAAIVTVGIGGSALGAATISQALGSNGISLHVLDNVDPEHIRATLDDLPLEDTVVNAVSKSGTTAETLANFLVVRDAMEEAGVDWTEQTIMTTGESGPLHSLAVEHDLPKLPVPDGVPGRFSALSPVGLVAPAIQGHDIEDVLAGAQEREEALTGSLHDCPGYAYGAVAYALDQRGASINAMMPYAEGLEFFSEWFAQLWAESLGKDGLGQTPARALGATDQHSQLQLYRAGPPDKMVTLVRPKERSDLTIPETDIEDLAYLGGAGLGELLDAEFEATEASLAEVGQPNVRIEIDELDEEGIGELIFAMEAACIMAGELYGIETFIQPAVEWGKKAARGLLGGGEFEEAKAVESKERLVID